MSLKAAIVRQFGEPRGLIGELAGHIMARRSSNRIRNRQTVEMMNLQPDSRVLEVGSGPGLALAGCAETIREGRIVGLDRSPAMIAQAQRRLTAKGLEQRVELAVGGIDRLADWPKAFDRVYSLNVIQFIADKERYFRLALGALDCDGICFTTYQPRLDNDDPNGAARMADDVARLMLEVGFQRITCAEIDAGEVPAVCVYGARASQAGHPDLTGSAPDLPVTSLSQ